MNDKNISTEELLKLIFAESSLEHWMRRDASNVFFPELPDYIGMLLRERGEAAERVIKRADIEKSFGHQIFSGRRKPSRDTVLRLAFGFELDYEGTQELLKVARKSPLHPKVRRDMVLVFCLQHKKSVVECQLALHEYGLPLLGEERRGE